MKNTFFKKSVSGILIAIILITSSGVLLPQKAEATGIPVVDVANLGQNIINVVSNIAQEVAQYSEKWKEFVGDGLARAFAQQLTQAMTASIVNWINSGFQGSPSFMTNPSSFFLDVADQITGSFLAKVGGPLTSLCSPFSIDVRLALAFKYHPNVQKKFACTLGTIIQNTKNAAKNATINGFSAGDFSQGGWPAFLSMTTEPQNNAMGAYLEADDELSIRVANAQLQQKDELNQGRGFLSMRDPSCLKKIDAAKKQQQLNSINPTSSYDPKTGKFTTYNAGGGEVDLSYANKSPTDCPVLTPGSVIAGSLDLHLGTALRQAELADEINEIVSALFSQLVTQVLKQGLGAVSGSGPSDSTSYINQIQNEANTNKDQIDSIRTNLLQNIDTFIQNTMKYKASKDASYNLVLGIQTNYTTAQLCYSSLLSSPTYGTTAQAKVSEITNILSTKVAPLVAQYQAEDQAAADRLAKLLDIKTKATAAQTLSDLNDPSQESIQLISSGGYTNSKDIGDAQQEYSDLKDSTQQMRSDSANEIQSCKSLGGTVPTATTTATTN